MRIVSVSVLLGFLMVCFFGGCGRSGQKVPVDDKKPVKIEKVEATPATGWNDPDTYTVKAKGVNLEAAQSQARHRILKDIVNARVLGGSRYTDITKISGEFDRPLKGGRVLKQKSVEGGIEIYFQIRDKGLKRKFERQ